jgi:hypothetical protein
MSNPSRWGYWTKGQYGATQVGHGKTGTTLAAATLNLSLSGGK